MAQFFKNNFPVETEEAKKFWASQHKCNKIKAIIAFSRDLDNANINLKRHGYSYHWRKKAIQAFGQFVNQPDMTKIPFTPMSVPWWECMAYAKDTNLYIWEDDLIWDDSEMLEDGVNSGGGQPIEPTSVVITGNGVANGTTNHVNGGDRLQLTAQVLPAEASQSVVWSTSDSQVATVNTGGLVTFVNTSGDVTIHATTLANSISSSISFSVTASPVSIVITGNGVTPGTTTNVATGSTLKLTASVLPAEAPQNIVWSSSDTNIATVSSLGLVTFRSTNGPVSITATSFVDSSKKLTVDFNVVTLAENLMPADAFDEYSFITNRKANLVGTDAVGRTGTIGREYERDYGGYDYISVSNLVIGKTYTYSFYAKNGTLDWMDWGILNPSTFAWVHSVSITIDSSTWKRYSYTFTAPATELMFYVTQSSYGDVYVSCFMLEEGSSATPFNPVA